MNSKWFFYGWSAYRSDEIAHVGAKTHYNINPVELYDLASVQQDLGWSHESKQTIHSAEKILGLKSYYARAWRKRQIFSSIILIVVKNYQM